MPNIASVLKDEISRVARKEVRAETQSLKKAVGAYRTEIAALKRRSQAMEQELHRLSKASPRAAPPVVADEETSQTLRFSAKGLASQRQRLGPRDECKAQKPNLPLSFLWSALGAMVSITSQCSAIFPD